MPLPLLLEEKKRDKTGNVGECEVERDTRTGLPPSLLFPTMTPACRTGEKQTLPCSRPHSHPEDKVQRAGGRIKAYSQGSHLPY